MNTTEGRRRFGTVGEDSPIELLTLDNGIISCEILTWGGTLRALRVPDRSGCPVDVALGCDTLEEYLAHDAYFGAIMGRYANRIAKGSFTLHGRRYALAVNNGPNHLHGGNIGFDRRIWHVRELTPIRAVLTLVSPDGQEGYPGTLKTSVTYELRESSLEIRYQAHCDQDTPCNLTNHSYFNLAGQGTGPVLDQEVRLNAACYTPADENSIPLGMLEQVDGTPMDLRSWTAIGAHIGEPFPQLIMGNGYDHNFAVDGMPGTLRPAAAARARQTGIVMEVETTMPGLQFYTANYVAKGCPGKGGAAYGPRHGFCFETQFFPDSPNQPAFPSAILAAGEAYDHRTVFRFSTETAGVGDD